MAWTPRSGESEIVQTEFEKALAGLVFATGVAEQGFHVFEAKGDTDLRKHHPLRHQGQISISRGHPLSSGCHIKPQPYGQGWTRRVGTSPGRKAGVQ